MQTTGKLFKDGQIAADGITVTLDFRLSGGVSSWQGSFPIPAGARVTVGDQYFLQLDDGRSGRILVQATPAASNQAAIAYFLGCGPLQ
jgi:hypothetical protein